MGIPLSPEVKQLIDRPNFAHLWTSRSTTATFYPAMGSISSTFPFWAKCRPNFSFRALVTI